MSEHDRSCVFSREPQLVGPSRRDDEPLDALCCANLYGDAEKMAVLRRGRSGSENSDARTPSR